ncbi:uncharacterized protein BT62DRAFT_935146 [Guyanagaster necrorhizus]|uniref:Uncharacterized protein n=1 Tax=Guyanagaster necrorhizus TaxID=856835 RepID=A0A9P8APP4_9AGAR|nr:uncharacterized protein BT62DRAFT_935146 [Guyanagaster necrorhizus MCA 3950]KAG7443194.1 hypothetical protein BT62DRAFT_935146 [Guyanagaster necrorhizus MCA 3950]
MAALYLHNAIFSPEPAELPPSHSRTISTATLRTIASENSHPTEPLLDPLYSGSAYLDLLERQPAHPTGPSPGWDMGLTLDYTPTLRERKGYWEKAVRRRLKVLKLTVLIFEMIMGAWAIYSAIRYFLAFAFYQSITGQDVSLALGTSTAVSATFLLCRFIVSFCQTQLIRAHVDLHSILLTRTIFRFLASIFLLGPAIVAFALTFVWQNVPEEPELSLSQRCGLDLDVVWAVSASSSTCQGRTHDWASWLGLSILRIFITLAIIIPYNLSSSAYQVTRRPSQRARKRRRRRHHLANPESVDQSMSSSPLMAASFHTAPTTRSSNPHLCSTSTITSSPRMQKSLRSSRNTSIRSVPVSDSPSSEEDSSSTETHNAHHRPIPSGEKSRASSSSATPKTPTPPLPTVSDNDRDLYHFVDRFHSLVSQISRETDEGLEYARPDGSSSSHSESMASSYSYSAAIGYDEFGRPYPPDDHVRVLGGYVRRMPTIESIGSREMGTTSSLHTIERMTSFSRPPTRNTHPLSSEPPSRSNSLLISACGELGEIVADHVDTQGSASTSGSQPSATSTISYYTAGSGSASPVVETPPTIVQYTPGSISPL